MNDDLTRELEDHMRGVLPMPERDEAFLLPRELCSAILAALRSPTPSEDGPKANGLRQPEDLLNDKWLDPECIQDGCQSLIWKARYEAAVQGRAHFRNAFREARAALKASGEPGDGVHVLHGPPTIHAGRRNTTGEAK